MLGRKQPAGGGDGRYSENIVVALVLASGGTVTIADSDLEDLGDYDLRMERSDNAWVIKAVHKQAVETTVEEVAPGQNREAAE